MNIVPTPATRKPKHPGWCDQKHPDNPLVHEGQVGADLELSHELAYGVRLQQVADSPTEVNLLRSTIDSATLTRLTLLEAGILRDLLDEALQLVAAELDRR